MKIKEKLSKGAGSQGVKALPIWIYALVAFMVVTTVVMILYYAFFRSDEVLQRAGMATDSGIPDTEDVQDDKELYGYEITEQDKRNEAEEIAPEIEPAADDYIEAPEAPSNEPDISTEQPTEIPEDQLIYE